MKNLPTFTVDDVVGFHPCGWDREHDGKNYTRQRVEELFAGRKSIDILDVVEMDIPDEDAIWLATRPGILSERTRLLWLASCAESVVENYRKFAPADTRVEDCIATVRQYAWGQTDIQHVLSAGCSARSAAHSAAYSANSAAYSAYSAAYSAACSAADSAHSAAYSANSAAYSAYSAVAYEAERELQVLYLLDVIVATENEG